ncbi:hypothetical protein [Alteromonas sp.]|uniref:hypothetical protein n=1 Tax=Alteromonas sp. TaxID=232 RepID=UPI0035171AF0
MFALTISRMLASLVFKKAKGTGFPSNKALKPLPSVAGTHTRGLLRIITHAPAPLSLKLAARMKSILYFVVLIVSFGPSAILLTLGVIFSPAWLYSMFESKMATLVPFLMVVAGLLGFWGMLALNNLTLYPYKTDTPPKRLIVYLSLGCIASLTATIFAAYMDWLLVIAMFLPIPVTACLTYRNRAYFHKQVCS